MSFLKKIKQLFITTHNSELSSIAFIKLPLSGLITDMNGDILSVNEKFTELTSYSESEALGENMSLLKSGEHDNLFYKNLWSTLLKIDEYSFEISNRCKGGEILIMQESIQRTLIAGKEYFVITLEDITESKKQEKRQLHLATHDPLTGLANRALLADRYKHAILNAQRNHTKLSVMLCDLNEFKQINDNYGHNVGDEVLKEVAFRLKSIVRESDTVARYGGDEFLIILEQVEESHVQDINALINENLDFTMFIEGNECRVSLSSGYACFPSDGTIFEQLVSLADIKMYDAKARYYGF